MTYWKNLKLSNVYYGFGWKFDNDPSTETLVNVLDRLDKEMKELKEENNKAKENLYKIEKAINKLLK